MHAQSEPISLAEFPRAILHIDGDCFFASCEIALNPKLKGLPVITGKERGIASSMNYEAKAMGVTRGMRLSDIKKVCPSAIILPSDYETYSLFSIRMLDIVRRYTPAVEEYSIDECFADLTGLRRPLNLPYETMAHRIQRDLNNELGMTFSVGLAPTKVLAKAASRWKKPAGLTIIPGYSIHSYLKNLPVEKIWGVGPATAAYLNKCGVITALDLASKEKGWIKNHLTKPHFEIWEELRGNSVNQVNTQQKNDCQSISKTRTFTPASNNKEFVFSQLSKNVENACIKARRYQLFCKKFCFFLKTRQFRYYAAEVLLDRATSVPSEIIGMARKYFNEVYKTETLYRATGITLLDLSHELPSQMDLFKKSAKAEKFTRIYEQVDTLSDKFGKHTVFLGSSMDAMASHQHEGDRGDAASRKKTLFNGETKRQRLGIPFLRSVKRSFPG
jgi:DNA polymerase-4/DNA polymerase V